jgi:hypothetical protein
MDLNGILKQLYARPAQVNESIAVPGTHRFSRAGEAGPAAKEDRGINDTQEDRGGQVCREGAQVCGDEEFKKSEEDPLEFARDQWWFGGLVTDLRYASFARNVI